MKRINVNKDLYLRTVLQQDVENIYKYASDPEVTKYLDFKTYESIDQARKFVRKVLRSPDMMNSHFGVIYKGDFIGTIAFTKDSNWQFGCAEVRYVIDKEYLDKGIVSQCLDAFLAYGFEKLDLEIVRASHPKDNEYTKRTFEQLPFICEGTKRKSLYLVNENKLSDVIEYSMTKEEYEGQVPA